MFITFIEGIGYKDRSFHHHNEVHYGQVNYKEVAWSPQTFAAVMHVAVEKKRKEKSFTIRDNRKLSNGSNDQYQ